jgi:hypothetical protein
MSFTRKLKETIKVEGTCKPWAGLCAEALVRAGFKVYSDTMTAYRVKALYKDFTIDGTIEIDLAATPPEEVEITIRVTADGGNVFAWFADRLKPDCRGSCSPDLPFRLPIIGARQPPTPHFGRGVCQSDDKVHHLAEEIPLPILPARHRLARRMRVIDRDNVHAMFAHVPARCEHAARLRLVLDRAGEGVDQGIAAHDAGDAVGADRAGKDAAAFVGEFRLSVGDHRVENLARQVKTKWR